MKLRNLQAELVPIDSVKVFKGNARIGNVAVIRESLRTNGQYRPIVVRRQTREILAGNHTWKAAKLEGYTEIWATIISCDVQTAKRINLVDNSAADHGEYDEEALVTMLGSLPSLVGTGYTTDDLTKKLGELNPPAPDSNGVGAIPDDDYNSQLGVIVMCTDQGQQEAVYSQLQTLIARVKEFNGATLKIVAI